MLFPKTSLNRKFTVQLNWDSQQGRASTTSILLVAFWNFKLMVLKYPRNCRLHNTLIPWSPKNPVSPNVHRLLEYSELSNKHAANLILFEKIFPPTCLIRTYTFIYFQGKFLPTRLLEYPCLLILAEIPNYKIILSSFKLLLCCFKHFKEASKS